MIQKKFGQAIKKRRESMGLSQEKFALSISMDRTYYSSVESGKRNISLQNIEKIATGLNISLTELFSDVDSINNIVNKEDNSYGTNTRKQSPSKTD